MPSPEQLVSHYAQGHPIPRIEAALAAAGLDLDRLEPIDVAGVDEFHLGGHLATIEVVRSMRAAAGEEVLDVGCGIGGVARTIAATAGCQVTGIDLTPTFVETATWLSERVGLEDRTRFQVASASALDFDADRFAGATLIHVGMNIENKVDVFAEIHRVLRPGSSLHVYDIMRVGDGELTFPVPWSSHAATCFLARPADYTAALRSAGFEVREPVNRITTVQQALAATATAPPAVNLAHLMGEQWPVMFANLRDALSGGVVSPVEIVATRPSPA